MRADAAAAGSVNSTVPVRLVTVAITFQAVRSAEASTVKTCMDYVADWLVSVGRDERSITSGAAFGPNAQLLELDLHVIEPIVFLSARGLIAELASVCQETRGDD